MSGLGGLNKSPNGVVVGLVQLQFQFGHPGRHHRAQNAAQGVEVDGRCLAHVWLRRGINQFYVMTT